MRSSDFLKAVEGILLGIVAFLAFVALVRELDERQDAEIQEEISQKMYIGRVPTSERGYVSQSSELRDEFVWIDDAHLQTYSNKSEAEKDLYHWDISGGSVTSGEVKDNFIQTFLEYIATPDVR